MHAPAIARITLTTCSVALQAETIRQHVVHDMHDEQRVCHTHTVTLRLTLQQIVPVPCHLCGAHNGSAGECLVNTTKDEAQTRPSSALAAQYQQAVLTNCSSETPVIQI